ncbi:hypothetical protein EVAR_4686_1 [Eumeta japonica]|uniref:G-protein coupled receptors family 1 profile domain-containing protein n=1 Tax=Eumeta variegata TaxID=151549 RepID=A0A4C1WN09_EUMVA|nr:hypothetical protein EVAR_4686_1 [Eumeta japonica]
MEEYWARIFDPAGLFMNVILQTARYRFVVCFFGSLANTLNVAVLTRRDLAAAPINRLLKWLAVADVFVMLEYVPFAIYRYMRDWCIRHSCTPTATFEPRAAINKSEHRNAVRHFAHTPQESVLRGDCQGKSEMRAHASFLPRQREMPYNWAAYLLFHMHFAQIFHTASICLTLSLAIWRFIAIKYSDRNHILCTERRCSTAILSSFALPPILCIPTFMVSARPSITAHPDSVATKGLQSFQ